MSPARDHILAFTAQDEAGARALAAPVDTPVRLRSRRDARAFTAGLVLILGGCLGFLGGVGYALAVLDQSAPALRCAAHVALWEPRP